MQNYKQDGTTFKVLLVAVITSGTPLLMTDTLGVAKTNGAIGEEIAFQVEGVVELSKLSTSDLAQGQIVYWDDTAKLVTHVSSGNKRCGVAARPAGNPSAKVWVKLNA